VAIAISAGHGAAADRLMPRRMRTTIYNLASGFAPHS